MPRRVWKYNALTNIITDMPVYSVVIYLIEEKESPITEPVYMTSFQNGHVVQWFSFHQIKLWELMPEEFEQPQLTSLLPLLPLTKNGQNRDTVERMIREIDQAGKQELLWLAKAVAGFVLTSKEDKRWLKERFQAMFDILKGSWVYQETIEEGRKEELERGLLRFVELRFPSLLVLTKQVIEHEMPLQQLQFLQDKLYLVNTVEEAKAILEEHRIEQ